MLTWVLRVQLLRRARRVSAQGQCTSVVPSCTLTELVNVSRIHSFPCQVANNFPGFKKAEDVEGECEQLMKKAIIARLRGDEDLAEEFAHDHNRVWDHGMERIASNSIEVA